MESHFAQWNPTFSGVVTAIVSSCDFCSSKKDSWLSWKYVDKAALEDDGAEVGGEGVLPVVGTGVVGPGVDTGELIDKMED